MYILREIDGENGKKKRVTENLIFPKQGGGWECFIGSWGMDAPGNNYQQSYYQRQRSLTRSLIHALPRMYFWGDRHTPFPFESVVFIQD